MVNLGKPEQCKALSFRKSSSLNFIHRIPELARWRATFSTPCISWSGFVPPFKEGKSLIYRSSEENFPITGKDLANPCTKPQTVVHTEPRLAGAISLHAMKTRARYQTHPVSQVLATTVSPPHATACHRMPSHARTSSQNCFISTRPTLV